MDTGVVEDHNLDRAFSRLFCIEYSVGMIPLSENYFGNRYDNFVRLSFNRCDSDI